MLFWFKGSSWLIIIGIFLVIFGIAHGARDILVSANLFPGGANTQDNFTSLSPQDLNGTSLDEMRVIYYQNWDAIYGPIQPASGDVNQNTIDSTGGSDPNQNQPAQAYIPDRIVIPAIYLDAPIIPVRSDNVTIDEVEYLQWLAPEKYAAGWHQTSATLGKPGNTVLNGHHNAYGEVFGRLIDLKLGDIIFLYSGDHQFKYKVTNKMILREKDEPISVRMENARWIEPTQDERVTLITCWPKDNNTHRFIVIAMPVK